MDISLRIFKKKYKVYRLITIWIHVSFVKVWHINNYHTTVLLYIKDIRTQMWKRTNFIDFFPTPHFSYHNIDFVRKFVLDNIDEFLSRRDWHIKSKCKCGQIERWIHVHFLIFLKKLRTTFCCKLFSSHEGFLTCSLKK